MTVDDIRSHERRLLESCRHLAYTQPPHARGSASPPVLLVQCKLGIYSWTPSRPEACASACPKFARQKSGPAARLNALRTFFAWLVDRGLVAANPVAGVLRKHLRGIGASGEKRKYAPTTSEVRGLVAAARAVATPREVAILLALAKWGRRPAHVLLVAAEDLHIAEAASWVTFEGARDRMERRNRDGHTKLRGNLHSPIDDELRTYLVETYLPYRARKWMLSPGEGPLFPSKVRGATHCTTNILQRYVLDPAMRHLEETAESEEDAHAWREHRRRGSRTHISPGCFRHWFTTTLEEFGVSREDRMVLRGDIVPGALENYRHIAPAQVCERYRLPPLLDVNA